MRLIFLKQKWLAIAGLMIILSAVLWPRFNIKEMPLSIRIRYANVPEGLTIIESPSKVLEVVVRGPKSKIEEISKNDTINYELDLSDVENGMNSFPVELEDIVLPPGVSVLRSNLSLLIVKVDKYIQKELPIRVVLSGKPGTGYVIADSVVSPSHVVVSGPKAILGSLAEVKTKPIEIGGVKDSLKTKTKLDLPEDLQIGLSEEGFVTHVYVEEKIIIKSFEQVSIKGKDTPYDYHITPDALDLKVRGPHNLVDKLSSEKGLDVFIDLKNVEPGVYVRYAIIQVPVGITLNYVKPEIFTVTVSKQDQIRR